MLKRLPQRCLCARFPPTCHVGFHSQSARYAVFDNVVGKKLSRAWARKDPKSLPVEATQASGQLRTVLGESKDREKIIGALSNLVQQLPEDDRATRLMGIIERSLNKLEWNVPVDLSQIAFRKLSQIKDDKGVLARLYLRIANASSVPEHTQIENAVVLFTNLRSRGLIQESNKLIMGIMRRYPAASADPRLLTSVLSIIAQHHPDPASLANVILATSATPDAAILNKVVADLAGVDETQQVAARDGLSQIVDHILFTNPHFTVSRESIVLLLDALISLEAPAAGRRVLHHAVQRLEPNDEEDLAYLELLVAATVNFEDSVAIGDPLVARIASAGNDRLVKETWDVLAMWAVYKSGDLAQVKPLITNMEDHGFPPDSTTLSHVLRTAIKFAKRNEQEVNELLQYMASQYDVSPDAVGYSLLIDRRLQSVEVEKARQLFIASADLGADWNVDDGKHLSTLHRLLLAVARTPGVELNLLMDLYHRVRLYSSVLPIDAQTEMVEKVLELGTSSDVAQLLVDQFGEQPSLSVDTYRDLYHVFLNKILESHDHTTAWNLYGILNTTIVLPYESYLPVQKKFCDLGRPDAAHLMFRHLRNRAKQEAIRPPGREMYLVLFHEYGKWQYEEGVLELETYFRMDMNNEMDNVMMNHILGAYSNLQDLAKISDLWLEFTSFPAGKGVNNDSITLMLKNYTRFSLEAVDDLWTAFPEKHALKPSADNLKQYVIANCYHGYYMRALEIAQTAPETYGIPVTSDLIESLYNWSLIDSRKNRVKAWAIAQHPQLWQELVTAGTLKENLIPENTENDSPTHLRAQTIKELESAGQLVRTVPREDED